MRKNFPVIRYIILGMAIWLIDAAIASLTLGMSFAEAAWTGVSMLRLVIRAAVMVVLLIIGLNKWRRSIHRRGVFELWQYADEASFIGAVDSDVQSQRLLYHALRLAVSMRMHPRDRENLRTLCHCYDIGLFMVPEEIVNKEDTLTDLEKAEWDKHIELGAEIMACIRQLSGTSYLVRCHEEYYNGHGYLGLQGKRIPLACRIFQVVWIYDSLIHPSGSNAPLSEDDALRELDYYAGNVLDPEVITAFRKVRGKKMFLEVEKAYSWR